MTTPTTNMNWTDPTVGASNDTWGDLTNAIWDNMDAHAAGLLYGLTLSAAGSTATFGVAAGAASGMALASAFTKTTSAWGVGTGQGALDTGAITNSTWYHVWLIQRVDTLVVDVLVSLSATAPTMPTNYTRKRRIGSMKTDGSAQWVKFSQFGDEFLWGTNVNDVVDATVVGATTAITVLLSVPTGIQVGALFTLKANQTINTASAFVVSSFDQTDVAASSTNYTGTVVTATSSLSIVQVNIRTNTSGQIRLRFSSTDPTYGIMTRGWIDRRGQN